MARDVGIHASFASASELLSHCVLAMFDTIHAAKQVLFQKENFQKFSTYLEKTALILKDLSALNLDCSGSLKTGVEILNRETKLARRLALDCSSKNKVYLLLNCRKIIKCLEKSTKEISRALTLLPLATLDVSLGISDRVRQLCGIMQDAEYRAAVAEQEILVKIETAIKEGNMDRSYANKLLASIAKAVGISADHSALKKEFEEFKQETENVKLRKDMSEALHMEQIISLLEKADATTSHEERERNYHVKRNSIGTQTLGPLQSFYCPITQDVMVDPVETSSGRTFERSAIERWFSEGNNICPVTLTPVDTSILRPNKTLRQSIEEWRDRNNLFSIVSIKPLLLSDEEQEVLQSLDRLLDLLQERELHQQWVAMENYIPALIGLLGSRNHRIRSQTLAILCFLAKANEDNKETIGKVDHALELIARSLSRHVEEIKLALQLLLELSRNNLVRDLLGSVQACILLLVTTLNSDDAQAANDAEEVLENLSLITKDVVQMAKANYFKPLLRLLHSGPQDVRVIMAETLSETELTDHSKLSLFRDGASEPLLQLLSHGDLEVKKVASRALRNLSSVPQNALQIIRDGAVGTLFDLLYRRSLSSSYLREQVAAIIMHLAVASSSQVADHEQVPLLETEEDVFKLFCLISLTGPDIQKSILRTFLALCQPPPATEIRATLRQLSAVQVLVQLCESHHHIVRANAVKLFCCLTKDGDDGTFLEHVNQKCVETVLTIIKTSNDLEEAAAAMGIISNLPEEPLMTLWLLDAGAIQVISNCLNDGSRNATYRIEITENSVKALRRFTVSSNHEWQKRVAGAGIIPVLVQLLVSGTAATKQNSATSLKQFSESSMTLSSPARKRGIFAACLAPRIECCSAHQGICAVESSFCLLEANAVEPLVRMLGETDPATYEASLDALLTLIDGTSLQRGSKVLDAANATIPIIKLLNSPNVRVQEKTLRALERMFRLFENKHKYGIHAKMPLIEIAQRGSAGMKSLAAKVLAQLDVLYEQSSFF